VGFHPKGNRDSPRASAQARLAIVEVRAVRAGTISLKQHRRRRK